MQLDGLVVALAVSAGACLGGGWWTWRCLVRARYLLDTPTSKIRSAAQGYVELYGVLQEQASLLAPLTNTPCLWWRFKIEEYCASDKRKTWRVLESGSSEIPLLLADGTGECWLHPLGAEIRPATRQVWQGDRRHPLRVDQGGLLKWLSSGKRYRYSEERLHTGEPLYAIGEFCTRGGGQQGLDLAAAQGAVIREWKGDYEQLLKRFDADGNRQLDEREWQRVRLAAQLEAEDRHRQISLQPQCHELRKPTEGQPFILSSHGEDQLARRFYWQALLGAVACLLGALAVALLLRNGLT